MISTRLATRAKCSASPRLGGVTQNGVNQIDVVVQLFGRVISHVDVYVIGPIQYAVQVSDGIYLIYKG